MSFNFPGNSPHGHIAFDGVIEIGENGFWRHRSPPTLSLHRAAAMFNAMNGETIIEIGSGLQGEMSGNSILVWAAKTQARKIVAIDLEEHHINDVRAATRQFPNVEALVCDGIAYLRDFPGTIDLLYLDFWTPDPAGAQAGSGRTNAYLQAYQNARDKLSRNAMILIDDTDHIHPWKHTLIVPEACKDGFREIWQGRQTLLARHGTGR